MNLLRQGFFISLGRVTNYFLGFVFTYIVARLFGAEILGNYVFLYSTVSILSPLIASGSKQGLMYYLPVWKDKKLHSRIANLSFLAFLSAFVTGLIIWMIYLLLEEKILTFFDAHNNSNVFWWFSSIIIFEALSGLLTGLLRGLGEIRFFSVGIFITSLLRVVLVVVFYYFLDSYVVIFAYFVSSAVTTGFYIIIALKLGAFRRIRKIRPAYYVVMTKKFFPVVITATIVVLQSKLSPLLIEFFLDSSNVGIYAVAINIATLSSFFLISLNMLISPVVAKLQAQKKEKKIELLYNLSTRFLALISFIFLAVVIVFGNDLLLFFGTEFLPGYWILVIICFGQLVNAISGSSAQIIIMMGNPRALTWFSIIAMVINVSVSLIFIPPFGLYGAAMGTAISVAIYNLLSVRFITLRLKLKAFEKRMNVYLLVQLLMPITLMYLFHIGFIATLFIQTLAVVGMMFYFFIVHFKMFWSRDHLLIQQYFTKRFNSAPN